MDWIKKNSEKFSLLVLSIALLAVSIFLFFSAQSFLKTFEPLKRKGHSKQQAPALETKSAGNSAGIPGKTCHMVDRA